MAVLRTRVTGPVMLPDGSPAPDGCKVIFRLRSWDRQDGALIMRGPKEAPVIGGVIDVTLERTASGERGSLYDVFYTYPNAAARGQWLEEELGSISLTGPGPVALADLLAIPAPVPNVPDALAQALGAAAEAKAMVVNADQVHADRTAAEAAADTALGLIITTFGNFDTLAQLVASHPTAAVGNTAFVRETGEAGTVHRWSGSAWVDTGESPLAGKTGVAEMATRAPASWVKAPVIDGVRYTPALDFDPIAGKVWFDGRERAIAEVLNAHGDGSYTALNIPAGLGAGYTVVHQTVPVDLSAATSGVAVSLLASGSPNTTETYAQMARAGGNRTLSQGFGARGTTLSIQTIFPFGQGIYAASRDAVGVKGYAENNPEGNRVLDQAVPGFVAPNALSIGRSSFPGSPSVITNAQIRRVLVFPGALPEATIRKIMEELSQTKAPANPVYPKWLMVINGKVPAFQYSPLRGYCWFNGAERKFEDISVEIAPGIRVLKTRPYGISPSSGVTVLSDFKLPKHWTHALNPISGFAVGASAVNNLVQNRIQRRIQSNSTADGSVSITGFIQQTGDTVVSAYAPRPVPGGVAQGRRGRGVVRGSVTIPSAGNILTGNGGRPVANTGRTVSAPAAQPDYWAIGGDVDGTGAPVNCQLDQVVIFAAALTADELQQAHLFNEYGLPPLFFMGDSFCNLGMPEDAVAMHLAEAGLSYIPMMCDGEGGSALNYQRDLLTAWTTAYPYLKKSILIENEGGYNSSGPNLAGVPEGPFTLLDVQKILIQMCALFTDPRWIYMHCETNNGWNADTQAQMANIRRQMPDAMVDATGLLQAQFTDSASYVAALTSGATPAAMRSDNTHLSWGDLVPEVSGYYWWGLAIAQRVLGWIAAK